MGRDTDATGGSANSSSNDASDRSDRGHAAGGDGSGWGSDSGRRDRNSSRMRDQREAREREESRRKAEAARKAREAAERKAREEAERKAKAKAEKEAREEEAKAAEEGRAGFSPMGGLSSYGLTYAGGGRGVLANMRAASDVRERTIAGFNNEQQQRAIDGYRDVTDGELRAGITERNIYEGAGLGDDVSQENIARLAGEAVDEKSGDMFTDAVTSPFGVVGKAANEVVDWSANAFHDLFSGETDWENAIKSQLKKDMSGDGTFGNVASGVQGTAMIGSLSGNGLAQSVSPIVSSIPVTALFGVADDAIATNNWIENNRQYLDANNLLNTPKTTLPGDGNNSRQSKGILANMRDTVTSSAAQQAISQTELPEFEWASGDDFNFNYGVGFKRNAK